MNFWQGGAGLAYRVKKTIVLVGMMGAGKTAVGQALARQLNVPFLDSDHEITRAANLEISEIFARDGEAFFRDREAEVIARLLKDERGVLSTGGGAFMAERNRDIISTAGVSVWLQADLELLWQRVRHRDTRPLLRTSDPYATLSKVFHERDPIYSTANITVKAHAKYSIERMASEVIQALRSRPDVIEKV